jgi:hypothetical protein
MSILTDKQAKFSRYYGWLMAKASELGFEVGQGEGWRPEVMALIYAMGHEGRAALASYLHAAGNPEWAKLADAIGDCGNGIIESLHRDRLAHDIILRKPIGGLLGASSYGPLWWEGGALDPLGLWWEGLDPDCCWGGRWGDYLHFSITHDGRR